MVEINAMRRPEIDPARLDIGRPDQAADIFYLSGQNEIAGRDMAPFCSHISLLGQ